MVAAISANARLATIATRSMPRNAACRRGACLGERFVVQRNSPDWRYLSLQQDNMAHTLA